MSLNQKRSVVATLARSLARRIPRLTAIIALSLLCASYGNAQNAGQLSDVVQLRELETPTDDLIRLSTGYADALREYKISKLSIDTMQRLRPNAVVTNLELQIANLNLEAAERKVRILRVIVEKQLAAAQNKLEITKYIEKIGRPADGNEALSETSYLRAQDEATVQILKMILDMR